MLGAICKKKLPLASIFVVEVGTVVLKKFVYYGDEGPGEVWSWCKVLHRGDEGPGEVWASV